MKVFDGSPLRNVGGIMYQPGALLRSVEVFFETEAEYSPKSSQIFTQEFSDSSF
jgi:hypothetical protein